jgi:hypothetical protein
MISNIIVKMAIWYQYPGVKTQDGDELHDATPNTRTPEMFIAALMSAQQEDL